MISFGMLSKKDLLLFHCNLSLLSVLRDTGFIFIFFAVSSGCMGVQHLASQQRNFSVWILTTSVFGPIQEELIFRGLLQGAVFDNSWLGLVLTSLFLSFSLMDLLMSLRLFYLLGGFCCWVCFIKRAQNFGTLL